MIAARQKAGPAPMDDKIQSVIRLYRQECADRPLAAGWVMERALDLLKRLYDNLPDGQRQFLTFSFVGGIGFVVDAGILSILKRGFGVDARIAGFVSMFVFAMTVTWYLNRRLTFKGQYQSPLKQYLRFALVNSAGNAANYTVYFLLVQNVDLFSQIPELAKVVGTAVGLMFNFTGSKFLVFRRT